MTVSFQLFPALVMPTPTGPQTGSQEVAPAPDGQESCRVLTASRVGWSVMGPQVALSALGPRQSLPRISTEVMDCAISGKRRMRIKSVFFFSPSSFSCLLSPFFHHPSPLLVLCRSLSCLLYAVPSAQRD